MSIELDWQRLAGVLLLISGGGVYAWQWWRNRPAKVDKTLATEAQFQVLLNDLRTAYADATAENKRQAAEIAAIRKVVGDPIPAKTKAGK